MYQQGLCTDSVLMSQPLVGEDSRLQAYREEYFQLLVR